MQRLFVLLVVCLLITRLRGEEVGLFGFSLLHALDMIFVVAASALSCVLCELIVGDDDERVDESPTLLLAAMYR